MFWPAAMVTIGLLPVRTPSHARPIFFSLPRTTEVRTASTSTFRRVSWTAYRISTLLASAGDLEQELRLDRLPD